MELAFEITKEYHGENRAYEAQQNFINVVQKKQMPDEIDAIKIDKPIGVIDLLFKLNFAKSKSEAKRLLLQGAVKFEDEKIQDINFKVEKQGILKSGKRNYAKIIF